MQTKVTPLHKNALFCSVLGFRLISGRKPYWHRAAAELYDERWSQIGGSGSDWQSRHPWRKWWRRFWHLNGSGRSVVPGALSAGVLQPTLGRSPPRLEPDAGLPFLHLKHTCNPFNDNIANSAILTNHLVHRCVLLNEIPCEFVLEYPIRVVWYQLKRH